MRSTSRLSGSKSILLVGTAFLIPLAGMPLQAAAQDDSDTETEAAARTGAEEIIVTATKRSESVQRVPVSIQALSPAVLEQHKVVGIDDYVKLLPSVSISTLGPGQTNIFFRGISTGSGAFAPSTGMYLDEVPVQGGGSLDLHIYDIARVEALSGPQGTLFGSNSLAGTLRIISNRPDPGAFEAGFDLTGTKFGPGDFGGMAEGYVNLPINDMIAFRMSAYYKKDGGFIDVVPGTVTYTLGDDDPTNDIVKDNASEVAEDVNTVEVYGARAALGIDLNDSWTVTPQVMAQRQKAKGSFLWDPKKGDLNVSTYSPALNDDKWVLASLMVEGKIGNLDMVYSGSYLAREALNDADYTYYSVAYDQFPGYTKYPLPGGGYLDPTQRYHGDTDTHRQTHELRFTSAWDFPVQATVGGFFTRDVRATDWNYYTPGVGDLDPDTITEALPPVRGDTVFLLETDRVAKDSALFGELSWEILDNLTFTGGIRLFRSVARSDGFVGVIYTAYRNGCSVPLTGPCPSGETEVRSSGETHKLNLTWQVDDDRMVYATYSTGFRPGGGNSLPGVDDYKPDTLANYELGFKTYWLDRMLRLNGAVYYDTWKGIQYRLATPGANGLSAAYNAGNARIYGLELDMIALLGNFTLTGTTSYTNSALTTDFCAIESRANPNPYPTCSVEDGHIKAPKGTRLPNQPRIKGSLTGRYEFETGKYNNFISTTVNYQGWARSYLGLDENALLGNTPAFTTFDFSIGTEFDDSKVEFFIQNVFDKRGQLNRNTFCQITICGPVALRIYSTKPQFFGLKYSQTIF